MSTTKLYGISLGPGDPNLITVKGLNILKSVDKIYYPGSLYKDGTKTSYSLSILEHYDLDPDKCIGFYLQMSLARTQAKEIYNEVFVAIQKDVANGLTVAVVAEGDISTYSSFSYLLEKAEEQGLEVDLVPGISSYAAGAALHKEPLCLQNERFLILPRVQSTVLLLEAIQNNDTVVLMKIVSVVAILDEVLVNSNYKVFYSEKLGTKETFISSNWDEIRTRVIPYFSLIMIKK
ncbi:precorrin-2 C(20)-methyltransferase [Flavobacterium sp. 7A]|uniref:precorrin-2 C(20)-methyltransferase n=1 Tax=Flavobacterium sp. 7A TaxID=2940571 RepID=UPI0022279FCB|nr:precorrin-2 C(20)-methyltransferase [Flavobacterium sp. 7A]MCW2119674.1 precorrin-2/cobalt-factor-2 C20-methyltransferase [Flavobacterium sp. 7A]